MITALIPHEAHLDLLLSAGLLCDVCQAQPWAQSAQYCDARICADCAQGEPDDEEYRGHGPAKETR